MTTFPSRSSLKISTVSFNGGHRKGYADTKARDIAGRAGLETFSANRPLVLAYFEALLRAEHAGGLRGAMAADFDGLHTAITAGIGRIQAGQPRSRRVDPEVAATLVMAMFDGLIV
jgi:hypothetical protein